MIRKLVEIGLTGLASMGAVIGGAIALGLLAFACMGAANAIGPRQQPVRVAATPQPTTQIAEGPTTPEQVAAAPTLSAVIVPTATATPYLAVSGVAIATVTPLPAPKASQNPIADFGGAWRLVDTVSSGAGAGQTFTFNIVLRQEGILISGGNAGMIMTGTVQGATAIVRYSQPTFGYSGTFTWTMTPDGQASGSFTSSAPNQGSSLLVRG